MTGWRLQGVVRRRMPVLPARGPMAGPSEPIGHLALEDIAASDFDPNQYGCELADLMGTLHGAFPDGRMTRGVETFRQAYRAVGLGWVLAPTGWPLLRPIFDALYTLFARHRVRVGRVFGRHCETDRCAVGGDRRGTAGPKSAKEVGPPSGGGHG